MKRFTAGMILSLWFAVVGHAVNDAAPVPSRKPCIPCDEADARATRGYPMRGKIIRIDSENGTVLVQHGEIPGVMRAMTMEFHAAADVIQSAVVEREFFGRIERRGKTWWVFNVMWLVPNP